VLTKDAASAEHNLHVINLFLELFGECEIRGKDLASLIPPTTRRINWQILPPGKHPWSKVADHVRKELHERHDRSKNPVLFRQSKIASHQPDEVYVGTGGFQAYMAYVFKKGKIAILESLETDNATYVFGKDWKALSQLTKAEILSEDLQLQRIIHSTGWIEKIDALFKK
jgi:hypothetical protein